MSPLRRLTRPLLAAVLSLGLVAGCTPPPSQGPAAGAAADMELRQSRELLSELRRRDLLIEDPALNRYVGTVARRIDAQRPRGVPPLHVHVIRSADVNAFTPGAGHVFFNAGMLAAMENEAQFAMVLAHEVAHIDLGHVTQGMQARQTATGIGALTAIGLLALGAPEQMARVGGGLGAQAYIARFTREQETEADLVGFRYHVAAGYDGREGAQSFAVMRRMYGDRGAVAQFFATHPQSAERQAQLERLAQAQGARGGRVAQAEYLRATDALRRDALRQYLRQNRAAEARQVRSLIDRTR